MNTKFFSTILLVPILLAQLPSVAQAQGVPFEETQKLLASDADALDSFGGSVAISGDTLVVGAHRDGTAGINAGSTYLFERDQGGSNHWGEFLELTAIDAANGDRFGWSVAINGDTVVIGAYGEGIGGSAYIFDRNQGGPGHWRQVTKVIASDAASSDFFGWSVAISGGTIVVGARNDDDAGSSSGSAYVFERNEGGVDSWGEIAKLTAADADVGDLFGESVAVSGDTIIVGAYLSDGDAGRDSGSAYVFERNEGGVNHWGEVAKLAASDAILAAGFGFSVAISGDTIIVGANSDDAAGSNSGSGYVFERDQGGADSWGEIAKLIASDATERDQFGNSVSISGDTIVVGAFLDDDVDLDSGSAYVFERDQGGPGNWGEVTKLTAADGASGDELGISVSTSGDTVVVGAHQDDDACPADPECDSGSAYIFGASAPASGPTLSIPSNIPTPSNLPVQVPITFSGGGNAISATTFSVDFDEGCLDFDPTDADSDGIPDAVSFSLPGDFTASVTYAAADTAGELDFAIADFSTPLASLPDGVIATVTFTPICAPFGTSIIAPVDFGETPSASFGDTAGQSVPGGTVDGSVEILGGIPGDCNADQVVDAGDISACVLEVFDGDGNVWTDVVGGTFLGNPIGCDANQDFLVDAGDISCKILLIFNGAGACTPPPLELSIPSPELRIGRVVSQGAGEEVTVPLTFTGNGQTIAASAFSIDYDETCLAFDPSDGISFALPAGMAPSVSFDARDSGGELDISFFDPALPSVILPDGVVATLTFTTQCDPGEGDIEAVVRFSSEPALSFGSDFGQSVPGVGLNGGVRFTSAFFFDGFESGDTAGWSRTIP